MTGDEVVERRNKLLEGDDLYKTIERMIDQKSIPAKLDGITVIGAGNTRGKLVISLYVLNRETHARPLICLYITPDVFDEEKFSWIDQWIPDRVSLDARIKLRALRVVFIVMKTVLNGVKNSSVD